MRSVPTPEPDDHASEPAHAAGEMGKPKYISPARLGDLCRYVTSSGAPAFS
jgi:hypothetical protein